jgi:hypothetical protein
VIDVQAPEGEPSAYDRVRLWVDPKIHVLLRAEAYDAAGERVRSMEVKSFKKIDEVWMIKNLDVVEHPSRKRTRLRVESVEILEKSVGSEPTNGQENAGLVRD